MKKEQTIDFSDILHEISEGADTNDGYDAEGAWRYCLINAVKTKVYTKYFTGTSDADSHTDIAHGIADHTKIVHTSVCIYNSHSSTYYFLELFYGASANDYLESRYNATNIEFHHVGSRFQGQLYRIKMDYYL